MGNREKENKAFIQKDDLYDKQIKPHPSPDPSVDFDTRDILFSSLKNVEDVSDINISEVESFNRAANDRDQIYHLIDTMAEDSTIASAIEIYTEDTCEYNDNGRIVWSESDNVEINKYITYLLDTMNVDKNIYKWANCLIKYGDVYLRLYRESEYDDTIFKKESENLNEGITIKAYGKNDKIVHYLEMVPNPAEIFELTKFGKTAGYIKAPTRTSTRVQDLSNNIYYKYKFQKSDIEIHSPKDYVHGCIDESFSRTPEEVSIFNSKDDLDTDSNGSTYTVKKGQSLFFNIYKTWRELMLLEVSMLLNRTTQSSIVRVIEIEVGDMDKNAVRPELVKIKNLIEQKAAIDNGMSYSEYTNPGPTENNIYVPTRNGQGAITVKQIGGDVNVGDLGDVEYFKQKFYSALRIPKQFLSDTSDSAGFNGGTSLSIISSRYAKAVKKLQNILTQLITDAINIILLDKGLVEYINKFTIHMLPPTTQEELDRRDAINTKINIASNVMSDLSDIEDIPTRLKIYKALLGNALSNEEVMTVLQEEIDKLEAENSEDLEQQTSEDNDDEELRNLERSENLNRFSTQSELSNFENKTTEFTPFDVNNEDQEIGEDSDSLPSPNEVENGEIDFSDNSQFE